MKSQSIDNEEKRTGSIVENECMMVTFRGRVVVRASGGSDVQEGECFFFFFARDRLRMHHVEKEDPFCLYTHSFPKSHWMGFGTSGAGWLPFCLAFQAPRRLIDL